MSTPPRTVWDHCLVWAELLVRSAYERLDRPTVEQEVAWAGADRLLTLVLLGAVLHRQADEQGLGASPEQAARLRLHDPSTATVEDVLRYRPHAALEAAQAVEGRGREEREQLLEAAAGGPDGWLLWSRVHSAASSALEVAVAVGRGTTITMSDLVLTAQRKHSLEQLQDVLGVE